MREESEREYEKREGRREEEEDEQGEEVGRKGSMDWMWGSVRERK